MRCERRREEREREEERERTALFTHTHKNQTRDRKELVWWKQMQNAPFSPCVIRLCVCYCIPLVGLVSFSCMVVRRRRGRVGEERCAMMNTEHTHTHTLVYFTLASSCSVCYPAAFSSPPRVHYCAMLMCMRWWREAETCSVAQERRSRSLNVKGAPPTCVCVCVCDW